MSDWIDYLKASEIIIGFIIMTFTGLLGLFAWWNKRSRRYVDSKADRLALSNAQVSEPLRAIENDLQRIDKDVVKNPRPARLFANGQRLHGVESRCDRYQRHPSPA